MQTFLQLGTDLFADCIVFCHLNETYVLQVAEYIFLHSESAIRLHKWIPRVPNESWVLHSQRKKQFLPFHFDLDLDDEECRERNFYERIELLFNGPFTRDLQIQIAEKMPSTCRKYCAIVWWKKMLSRGSMTISCSFFYFSSHYQY